MDLNFGRFSQMRGKEVFRGRSSVMDKMNTRMEFEHPEKKQLFYNDKRQHHAYGTQRLAVENERIESMPFSHTINSSELHGYGTRMSDGPLYSTEEVEGDSYMKRIIAEDSLNLPFALKQIVQLADKEAYLPLSERLGGKSYGSSVRVDSPTVEDHDRNLNVDLLDDPERKVCVTFLFDELYATLYRRELLDVFADFGPVAGLELSEDKKAARISFEHVAAANDAIKVMNNSSLSVGTPKLKVESLAARTKMSSPERSPTLRHNGLLRGQSPVREHSHGQLAFPMNSRGRSPVDIHSRGRSPDLHSHGQPPSGIHSRRRSSIDIHSRRELNSGMHSRGRSPTDLYSRREPNSDIHYPRRSPTDIHSRGRSPTDIHSRRESTGGIHSRGRSPTDIHSRRESLGGIHSRGRSPDGIHSRGRSPGLQSRGRSPFNRHSHGRPSRGIHSRERSPATDRNRRRSPICESRRLPSPKRRRNRESPYTGNEPLRRSPVKLMDINQSPIRTQSSVVVGDLRDQISGNQSMTIIVTPLYGKDRLPMFQSLKNLFKEFGDITRFFTKNPSSQFVYITYDNRLSAEKALNYYNEMKTQSDGIYLSVTWASKRDMEEMGGDGNSSGKVDSKKSPVEVSSRSETSGRYRSDTKNFQINKGRENHIETRDDGKKYEGFKMALDSELSRVCGDIKTARDLARISPISLLNLPEYDKEIPFGMELIEEMKAFVCVPCRKEMLANEVERHCKSQRHYDCTLRKLKGEDSMNSTHFNNKEEHDFIYTVLDEGDGRKSSAHEELNGVDNSIYNNIGSGYEDDNDQDNFKRSRGRRGRMSDRLKF